MKFYELNLEDFKRVFEFGTQYYIDPSKNTTGRTTGEPRGLGAILDSFTLGKLTEIGVEKILKNYNHNKDYILDFDIKKTKKVQNDPDIIGIKEKTKIRNPKIFIEIKNTSEKDRWIGLTEEQYSTMKRGAGDNPIFIIYASIKSNPLKSSPRTSDLTGMFLKEIEDKNKSKIFQKFANLNAKCKIEFILSSEDLDKFFFPFEKGMDFYETNPFQERKRTSFYCSKGIRKDVLKVTPHRNIDEKINILLKNNISPNCEKLFKFNIRGDFDILEKKSSAYIECLSDIYIKNEIFGKFKLLKGKFYTFNLLTLGRNSILKRNNLFISKRRVYQLLEQNKIKNPEEIIKDIANKI
jgi:hypothetical protein